MLSSGKTIIESYKKSYPNNLDALIKGMRALPNYSIRLFDSEGTPLHETGARINNVLQVSSDQLRTVLDGAMYRSESRDGFKNVKVGLPFTINGKSYALFLALHAENFVLVLSVLLRTEVLIVLCFGSLLIAISSIFIVRPVKRLTHASRQMTRGDFSIQLHTRSNDEIGQLTRSFNQMAMELGTLDQIRRQFVSDVSHEIQTPLQSILGFTHALKQKKLNEADRLRLLTIIEEESNRLSRLTADLLQLSSLENAQSRLEISTYSLDEQLRNVIILLEPQWSFKRIDIELVTDELFVLADEDKLNQLWTNLIGNAIKFTNEEGKIQIYTNVHHHHIEISIDDSGQGIPEEELSHIFKPFYKVEKSRNSSIPGNGMGLSIVKRIVDMHDGDIRVTSTEGIGTTVKVILPQVRLSIQHGRRM